MLNLLIVNLFLAVNIDWDNIFTPLGELFLGGDSTIGIIGDNQMLVGLILFSFLFIMTLMFGLGMLVGSVAIIPSLFAVFQFIPSLQIIVAIICGLLFGITLHKIIKR